MKITRIGDVAKIFNGYAFKSEEYSNGGYQVIRITNVQNGYISNTNPKFIKLNNKELERFTLKEGDILISLTGNVGRTGRIEQINLPAVLNQRVGKVIIQSDEVLPEYLFHILKSSFVESKLIKEAKGIAQKNIGSSDIENLKFPLPSLEDQERIIKILDQADSVRQKRKQSIDFLKNYLKSVFIEIFGDQNTNPKNWATKRLDEIANICSGVTKGRKFGDSKTVYVPYMRVANVQDEHIDLSEIKEIEVLPNDIERYRLLSGDILLTEGGDPDKLGRGGIWRGEIENCIHQNHIFRVRLNNKIALPEYISSQIGSNRGKKYFLKSAKQTTGIATINITQLKNYPTLIPPLELQIKYGEIVKNVGDLKQKMIMQSEELENQFQTLTQKAFKGEL